MFEQFSSGYYLGRLYVEPYDGEVPAIHRTDHERVNEELYADEGVTRLDAPLVMKLEQAHIPVLGDEAVPSGTLAVPSSFADESLPDDRDVLLAKRERAAELLRYSGYKFGDDAAVT
ncbi:hypothetical protein SAMN04488063_2133 [Halopelagius inordinatus]|uniref:Uncharacterized protein n=1 Tax=Halopelagius inordinatus TaxID=553467 RepID=A0A1I2S0N9_9EURY|nr:DUF5802 family protein [Halopelagius inordinatus]SFG46434.1 hypothetical protein SAMN04488063_2133 [Halopelagius inordinatus]